MLRRRTTTTALIRTVNQTQLRMGSPPGRKKQTRKSKQLEARVAVHVTGLEWYVYNRTPAYDAIVENVKKGAAHEELSRHGSLINGSISHSPTTKPVSASEEAKGLASSSSGESYLKKEASSLPTLDLGPATTDPESLTTSNEDSTDLAQDEAAVSPFYTLILKLLPIGIECTKGAISLGNETTKAIVVTTFAKAKGRIDASRSEARDIYRQVFDFEVEHPVVQMKPNPEYRQSQHTFAERIIQGLGSPFKEIRWWQLHRRFPHRKLKATDQLRKLVPGWTRSVESFRPQYATEKAKPAYTVYDQEAEQSTVWHGLDRYLDEEYEGHEAWAQIDYARFSTILDSPAIHLNFYWDTPGPHTDDDDTEQLDASSSDEKKKEPPAYGMQLIVRGGDVNYGPWADRLRLEIQTVFFPNPYHNAEPAEPMGIGSERQYTVMNIRVRIEDDVTLRVPTREQSKDWQWRGKAQAVREAAVQKKHRERRHFRFRRGHKTTHGLEVRPFGWMAFTIGPSSTVSYNMGMIAGKDGYRNSLRLELQDTRATSSVNHAILWRCPTHIIDADLSYPLIWNDLHHWTFNVRSDDLDMFILRDHMFLLIDLINDFTAAAKSEFMTFVPFRYRIGLLFNRLKLRLNANDFNIIDSPCDLEENAYLTLGFGVLDGCVEIPLEFFAPRQSKVLFGATAQNGTLDISAPTWNTLHSFLQDPAVPNISTLMTLKGLKMDGSYNYYTKIAPNLSDSLLMTIIGYSPKFYLHGFLIRYFNNVKENYFGEHLHFRTLEEYMDLVNDIDNTPLHASRPLKKENDLDVILTVRAENSCIVLPTNIYSRRKGIRADILLVDADMRFTNYYMDLQVNSSPVEASIETLTGPDTLPEVTSCQLFVESAIVVGHRLFGAPPSEPTYSCHWDVDVGTIYGECSPDFLGALIRSIQSLMFTIDDFENALPDVLSTPIHDVNFIRIKTHDLRLWIVLEDASFLAEMSPSTIDVNDWVNKNFSKQVNVDMPSLSVGAVQLESAVRRRQKSSDDSVATLALFTTSCRLATLEKAAELSHLRDLQQQHIRYHDLRTHRADWLLEKSSHHAVPRPGHGPEWSRDPPAIPTPSLPEPLTDPDQAYEDRNPALSRRVRRQQSFLSSNASTTSSQRWKAHTRNRGDRLEVAKRNDVHRQISNRDGMTKDHKDAPGVSSRSNSEDVDPTIPPTAESIPISSPWTLPRFNLLHVRPSVAELPDVPLSPGKSRRSSRRELGKGADSEDGRKFAHIGILCVLPAGLRGYCTPALLPPVAALVQALQPTSSLDRLDQVQQTVMDLVMQKLRPDKASKDIDLAIRLPSLCVRLLHTTDGDVPGTPHFRDQCDINIIDGHADCRFMTRPIGGQEPQFLSQGFLVHAAVRSLSVSVSDNGMQSKSPASASLTLSNLGLWLSSMDRFRGTVQVNSMIGDLGASSVQQTAELIYRTTSMVDNAITVFSSLGDTKKQHLIFHLTQAAEEGLDPIFLTRPSYVLRSAGAHARTSESWKILARLRYTFESAFKKDPNIAFDHCPCEGTELHDEAREEMMSIFDKWRVWDAVPDSKIPVMIAIFGQGISPDGSMTAPKPLELEVVMGELALRLNPGHQQSSIILNGLETGITFDPFHISSSPPHRAQKLMIQAYMADFAVNLNWELVDLVGNVFELAGSQDAPDMQELTRSLSKTTETDSLPIAFEVVIGTDLASISLKSPNLLLKLGSEGLRFSIANDFKQQDLESLAFTVASRTAMARLDGLQHSLLSWKLSRPKIYGSFQLHVPNEQAAAAFRMGADCDRLRFNLREDIPSVLRVVQAVVKHEVQEAQECLAAIPQSLTKGSKTKRPSPAAPIDFHIAMFLHDYKLDFTVLPSLRYAITGRVARTSVIPKGDGHFVINFDLKNHEHSFRGIWGDSFEEPAVLHMPAINGQISVLTLSDIITLKAHTTVEQIEFEAAAVRACFDVINQPGFLHAIKDTQADINTLQASIERTITKASTPIEPKPESSQTIRFAVDATLAGLRVHCVAPALQTKDTYADLTFGFGATSFRIHNVIADSSLVHEMPQFQVFLQEIGLSLYRQTRVGRMNYGRVGLGFCISGITETDEKDNQVQVYEAVSRGMDVELFEETASLVVDVVAYLQDRIKSITISDDAKNFKPIRRLTMATLERPPSIEPETDDNSDDGKSSALFASTFAFNIDRIQIRYGLHDETLMSPGRTLEALIFSIRKIDLQTRQEGSARLSILDTQLQLVPHSHDPLARTSNSALLPEMIFSAAYLSTKKDRRFAFQAKGKALDLRLAADFIVPASTIQKSLAAASAELRSAQARFGSRAATPEVKQTRGAILGRKRLGSLLVDVDFAGAVVHITPKRHEQQPSSAFGILKGPRRSQAGRYSQVVHGEDASQAVLTAPGVALKVQYHDNGKDDPTLSTELKVAASSNTLYPSVVPLVLDISSSIKEILGESSPDDKKEEPADSTAQTTSKYISDATIASGDPDAILGKVKLNAGLLIERQEFSLSCQPIARVSATAKFEDIYVTVNTVQAQDHSRFFSVLTTFNGLKASVQHVYSRESTASLELDSIALSLMNSKHVSGTTGISAILKVSPLEADINAKQVQDFLLFREIWYPAEMRSTRKAATPVSGAADTQAFAIQRYQQLAASGTLPWNAIVAIEEVKMQVDFGSNLGKSTFLISKLWASSKKNSDAEQNLCVGFDKVGVDSSGRMSGFVELQNFRVRTSIRWPADSATSTRAPLVQASVGLDHLRIKAAFDYQPFAVADISTFEIMMYNVRQSHGKENDRLVAILTGGKVQAFITALAGAQGLALTQAFERLIQEAQEAYVSSLHELDRFLRRKSVFPSSTWANNADDNETKQLTTIGEGFSLHTDVVVTLNAVDIGIFPSTFFDNQILKLEASDVQARFAVTTTEGRIHSGLGMRLGQVRVALSTTSRPTTQALGEVSVPDVIERATTARGGTIMKVPRLVSSMQTWQAAHSNTIEYIFRSTFEGKVDVGWNYSRISFIRGMWSAHSRAFAQRLGKPLPESVVKITAEPEKEGEQEKITAVVNMPTSSRYRYVALEPPVIDTPQLRDMGEATPPLEWIGLHRDRLPEATHSVAIVTLMEVAKEVEDAYVRILGNA